ncbi:hypothetical protein QBC35DRAFT_510167 [Podospora australis]|uniref:Uncharacterized protein n=1 Tax=Podospora australis TaxID=1536484 RepID=A0AAN6WJE1_9PEZI|nr:hypothetical protein QBC35DRAFT_510167 [Podospora australis]
MLALNLAALSLLLTPSLGAAVQAASQPTNSTRLNARENPAVVFTTWADTRQCNTNSKSSWTNSDGPCYSLPGQSMSVGSIANTCRTFIYGNSDCTGTEMQVYPGTCYDVRVFHTLKTFCH